MNSEVLKISKMKPEVFSGFSHIPINLTTSSSITLLAPYIQSNICDYNLLISFYFDNINCRVESECAKD
jgi:hypothetical protein